MLLKGSECKECGRRLMEIAYKLFKWEEPRGLDAMRVAVKSHG